MRTCFQQVYDLICCWISSRSECGQIAGYGKNGSSTCGSKRRREKYAAKQKTSL